MNIKWCGLILATGLLGCAGPGALTGQQSWRCEHGIDFRVRFVDDSALLEGTRANEVLFRDAGGQGPQQSVYSNAKMRAEFGLGAHGREALLTYPALPLKARCVRD
jgi:hypothetical protein